MLGVAPKMCAINLPGEILISVRAKRSRSAFTTAQFTNARKEGERERERERGGGERGRERRGPQGVSAGSVLATLRSHGKSKNGRPAFCRWPRLRDKMKLLSDVPACVVTSLLLAATLPVQQIAKFHRVPVPGWPGGRHWTVPKEARFALSNRARSISGNDLQSDLQMRKRRRRKSNQFSRSSFTSLLGSHHVLAHHFRHSVEGRDFPPRQFSPLPTMVYI